MSTNNASEESRKSRCFGRRCEGRLPVMQGKIRGDAGFGGGDPADYRMNDNAAVTIAIFHSVPA